MRRVAGVLAAVAGVVAVCGLAATFSPPLVWPDAPAPPALATYIAPARQHLWTEATDGLRVPLHLTFIEARCGADGAVALIFDEHRPPYTDRAFGYVARGSMPTSADDSWSGGYGIAGSVFDDSEFVHLLGPDPVPCPGLPQPHVGAREPEAALLPRATHLVGDLARSPAGRRMM